MEPSNAEYQTKTVLPPYGGPEGTAPVPVTIVQQPSGPGFPTPGVVPVLVGKQMSFRPERITCLSCNQDIVTKLDYKPAQKTHLAAFILCLVFLPCMCLPYCIDSCHNVDHYCPNCDAYIGSFTTTL